MSENSFEDIISKIGANPDLLNKISSSVKDGDGDMGKALSSVIDILSQSDILNQGASKEEKKDENDRISDTSLRILDKKDEGGGVEGFLLSLCKAISKNAPLLIALKPYLSKGRCDMIDSIVKMSQLAGIVNLAK